MTPFRPWGHLNWLLKHLSAPRTWALLGVLGPEERSLSVFEFLAGEGLLGQIRMLEIMDVPHGHRWFHKTEELLGIRKRQFEESGGDLRAVTNHELMARTQELVELAAEFPEPISGGSLILDISSMPKRFFFPLTQRILANRKGVKDLIVTYSTANAYAGTLSEGCLLCPFPLFDSPSQKPDDSKCIVGIGYQPTGLTDYLKDNSYGHDSLYALFPFPANPQGVARNWEFLRELDKELPGKLAKTKVLNPNDVPEVFQTINSLTEDGQVSAAFAPYGPKPMSLAMCLYACKHPDNSSIFYAQPTVYNPEYSTGVKSILAYAVRLNGIDLY